MRVFLICPVRNATQDQQIEIQSCIENLKGYGNDVYYPATDTDQTDDVGLSICRANMDAMRASDWVFVYYDKNSTGSLFDLGMAFSMGKPILLVNKENVERTPGKSFANVLLALHDQWFGAQI